MASGNNGFDIAVVGSGPGGYVAAIRAAQLGQRTAIVERDSLGGVCLNWGCIPSKALLASARLMEDIRRADEFGLIATEPRFDWAAVVGRSRRVADRTRRGVQYLMKKNGVTVYRGLGRLLGGGRIRVEGEEETVIESRNIILATGGKPRGVPGIEIDREQVISSREALVLESVPGSIVIVGGGAIGVEFAHLLHAFGAGVTVVEVLDRILPQEDEEVSVELRKILEKRGIEILTGSKVSRVETGAKGCKATVLTADGVEREIACDKVLAAVGVTGNIEGIGLEQAGVETEKGFIRVDESYRTTAAGISAVGDCIGPPLLAHCASSEGVAAVDAILGREFRHISADLVPSAVYCEPQVASIGLTEKRAREEGYDIQVGRFPFRPLGKALAYGTTDGFVKVVRDRKSGRLLGAHIIGAEATELIPELTLARGLGLDVRSIHESIHPHPTLSEALMEAAADSFGEAIHI